MLTDRLRAHRGASSTAGSPRWTSAPAPVRRSLEAVSRLSSEWRDALLYGCSALFALITAFVVHIPLYRQWGQMAVGPYAAATVLMTVVAWRVAGRPSRPRTRLGGKGGKVARVTAFLIVLLGATVLPMTMEVVWRSEGNAALHVQPEVVVVEQAGVRAAHGKDPYQVVDRNGHILIHQSAEPTYELYYPYLPGMVIFGFSSGSKVEARLTDARVRAFQVITALPTAALPLATGGDDMPVVALMLLGLVALQRRRPVLAGLALGAASSLKFSAWPVVVFALWAAYDLQKRRAVGRYALGVLAVVVPVVVPVALRNPSAFIDNVIRFPLGLAGVSSPAASALPGHILISILPGIHRPYVVVAGVVGAAVLIRHLIKKAPRNAAEVASLTGWVMLIAIFLAPATRVGYLLYPINLFVWSWMLRRSTDPVLPDVENPEAPSGSTQPKTRPTTPPTTSPITQSGGPQIVRPGAGQLLSSDSWNSWSENGVIPAEVVGDTTSPTSQ